MHKKSIYDSSLWDNRNEKIAILIPSRDVVYSHFTFSLTNIVKTSTQAGLDIYPLFNSSTILLNQREYLVKEALDLGADWLFWMDSDMFLPSTTLLRLLAHEKDIVCGNYMKRAAPFKTVAYKDTTDWESWVPMKQYDELVEVDGVGLGCCLMKADIFKKMEKPWFEFTYKEDSQDWYGEDFNMFKSCQKLGYKVYLDMVLSEQIKHMGTFAFGNRVGENRKKAKYWKDGKKSSK